MPKDTVSENILNVDLHLINISFKAGLKWKVNWGDDDHFVSVEDEIFLQKIDENEVRFSKGDRLKVELKQIQYNSEKGLETDYIITKVIDHQKPHIQKKLDL